jgi:hypothetical protein
MNPGTINHMQPLLATSAFRLVDTWWRRLEGKGNTTVGRKREASSYPHHSVLQVRYGDEVLM